MSNQDERSADEGKLEYFRSEISRTTSSKRKRALEKFALAALGSIPWVGGFIAAALSLKTEEPAERREYLQTQWLEEHTQRMHNLRNTLGDVAQRFESLGEEIDDRLQSDEYLDIVRKAFRAWDDSDTDEKRRYVGNLVANSAGTVLCSDDVIRLFIDWLESYHEAHFAVVREVHQNPGSTRYEIWMAIHGKLVREDSAEADLYKLLIRDLSTGGVIRQARETTEDGRFLKRRSPTHKGPTSSTMESAFEDTKQYVLTELGRQFVHYTMNELVHRVAPKQDEH